MKGCMLLSKPISIPAGRALTCMRSLAPSATAVSVQRRMRRQSPGLRSDCARMKETGSPVSRERSRIHTTSSRKRPSMPPMPKSVAISNTPWPARPQARPMPISSSWPAKVPGTGTPSMERCSMVRDEEKPSAPARSPSSTMSAMAAMVITGRVLVGRPPFAHRIGPDRAMRHLGADIEGVRHGLQRVEIFREGLPVPAHALGKRRAGNVLHAFHQADQPIVAVGRGGREADAAIAHHRGGDARASPRARARGPRSPGRRNACGHRRSRARPAGRPRRSRAGPVPPCRPPGRNVRRQWRYRRRRRVRRNRQRCARRE